MEDDDISVVTLQDSDGADDLRFPNFNIRLLPSMTNVDSEIKQAHTALNTAYSSIKSKLSKVEQENKELKMLLNRKKPSSDQPRGSRGGSYVEQNGRDNNPGDGKSHSEILRQKRPGLTEENQHKRHGSWAYFNDAPPSDQAPYVQFIETQIENIESEKLRLQEELEQLRVRYTDNELQITKLKQENHKQDATIQQLKANLQEKCDQCHRQQSENEELRKMNINIQQQLKRAVESYERVCVTNKTLEDRLQHHVDVQTKRKPSPSQSQDTQEALRLSIADICQPPNNPSDRQTADDTELLMSSLHQSLNYIQEQNREFSTLKKLVLKQQTALKGLRQKLAEAHIKDNRLSIASVTMQHPIVCEDDLENLFTNDTPQKILPPLETATTATTKTFNAISNSPYHKLPATNQGSPTPSEPNNLSDNKQTGLKRHKLRFPSQNSDDDNDHNNGIGEDARQATPLLEEAPWTPVKNGGGGLPLNNLKNPFLLVATNDSSRLPGEIRSDGPFDDGELRGGEGAANELENELPTAVNYYCESGDFTIHDSGGAESSSSQTQVKHRLPSTNLSHFNPPPPPLQMPSVYRGERIRDWGGAGNSSNSNYQDGTNAPVFHNGIAYPPITAPGLLPQKNTDHQQVQQQKNRSETLPKRSSSNFGGEQLTSTRLSHSQSETIGCGSTRPTVVRRQRHGSSSEAAAILVDPDDTTLINDHSARCTQITRQKVTSTTTSQGRQSPRQQQETNARPSPTNLAGVTLPSSPLNPFRPNNHAAPQGGNSPRPLLNSIEQNLVSSRSSNKNHHHSNIVLPRDVNINPEQPIEKLPASCSEVRLQNNKKALNNDPLLNELGAPKPVAHHNLNNTYLTVKLPPVENAEPSPPPTTNHHAVGPEEAQTCPVCCQLFPTTTEELQREFERHVNDCLPENGGQEEEMNMMLTVPGEERRGGQEGKQCIMCEQRFPAEDQTAYEAHVQSHFEEEVNFEVLQV